VPLSPGIRVGAYEVIEPLGEGGMGQVWRARDLRLPREVAIKVLPDLLAADRERLARFDRESAILAGFSHPHIAVIHGVEEGPFGYAIVMELVPGAGLDARLAEGPLPLGEALTLARDVADALETAHEHGVVHRDLKPANLKFSGDGRVKVLDFGLARAAREGASTAISRSPTAIAVTEAGTLLGTAAYMAPEQARGQAVDRRADIWAFGCVLYEALTARAAFGGATVADVLGAILREEPEWSRLPEGTPPSVRRLIDRCLRKDPRQRLRDIGDARLILEEVLSGSDPGATTSLAQPGQTTRLHVGWGLAALTLAGLAAYGGYSARSRADPVPLRKLEITVDDPVVSGATRPALAPGGEAIVYAARDRLWIRRFDQADAVEVPGSRLAERPFWSPDGAELAFAARGRLWKVRASGGDPVPICDLPLTGRILAGAWRPDGTILVSSLWYGAIYQVPANGGDPAVFYEDRTVFDFHEITLLPDGRTLLLAPHALVENLSEIAILRDGRRRTILPAQPRSQVDMPRYSASGHLMFVRQDVGEGVWAVPFDVDTLAPRGDPFRVVAGSWVADVAGTTLAYSSPGVQHQLVWLDRSGAQLASIGPAHWLLANPAIAPDGRRVAISAADVAFTAQNLRKLRIFNLASGQSDPLTAGSDATDEANPEWSPDGERLVFADTRRSPSMLRWRRLRDGALPELLTPGSGRPSFAPDGRTLAFARAGEAGDTDIWAIPVTAGGQAGSASVLIGEPGNQRSPRFSADGRFLAYESDESGRPEIYVRRLRPTGERWLVSRGGGSFPRWSREGPELFYLSREGSIMAVPVTLAPTFGAGEPSRLYDESLTPGTLNRDFDVSADGQRFLAVRRASGVTGRIVIVQNWLREFTR
jgi:Tol biopolymer transport system component